MGKQDSVNDTKPSESPYVRLTRSDYNKLLSVLEENRVLRQQLTHLQNQLANSTYLSQLLQQTSADATLASTGKSPRTEDVLPATAPIQPTHQPTSQATHTELANRPAPSGDPAPSSAAAVEQDSIPALYETSELANQREPQLRAAIQRHAAHAATFAVQTDAEATLAFKASENPLASMQYDYAAEWAMIVQQLDDNHLPQVPGMSVAVVQAVCRVIEFGGLRLKAATAMAGVPARRLRQWQQFAAEGREPYTSFMDIVAVAEARNESKHVANFQRFAQINWQATQSFLKMRHAAWGAPTDTSLDNAATNGGQPDPARLAALATAPTEELEAIVAASGIDVDALYAEAERQQTHSLNPYAIAPTAATAANANKPTGEQESSYDEEEGDSII